jgi:hypothetical protein
MIGRVIDGAAERLPPRDSKVSAMRVADRGEPLYCYKYFLLRLDDHIDVQNRLGRETRHGRASNVFDGDRAILNNRLNPLAERLKIARPTRVVINNDQVHALLQLPMECFRITVADAVSGEWKAALRGHLHAHRAIGPHHERDSVAGG